MLSALSTLLATLLFCQTGETPVTPTPITVGQELSGSVEADETRQFVITAKANDCIHGVVVSTEGDVAVEVHDPSTNQLLTFDRFSYPTKEAFCFKVLEDGDYPITIFSGNDKKTDFLLYVGFSGQLGTTQAELLQHYLQMQPPSLPGNAVAMIRDGEIEHLGARGIDRTSGKEALSIAAPLLSDALLAPMAASACYLMAERDELSTYSDVRDVLPWVASYPREIRISDLLRAGSGLPSVEGIQHIRKWDSEAKISEDEAREMLSKKLLLSPSRRYPRTCDSDIYLMLEILSAKTGLSQGDALAEVLFTPLGMTNSSLVPGDGFLPQISASIEDVSIWMAAMQATFDSDWNLMQKLAMDGILENYQWYDSWYLHMTPGKSFAAIEMRWEDRLTGYAGAELQTILNDPWPWFKPSEKIGQGRYGGRFDRAYRAGENSPRRGRYFSELLGMELRIGVANQQLTLTDSIDVEHFLVRASTSNDSWRLGNMRWLWLEFDDYRGDKAHRLIMYCENTQVEFLRVRD